jgi:hypothetical protein
MPYYWPRLHGWEGDIVTYVCSLNKDPEWDDAEAS